MKEKVAQDIRNIFNAPNLVEAQRLLKATVEKYEKKAPELSKWMEKSLPEGFTVFDFPIEHRKKIRTSNLIERLNKELKRRTRVVTIFPNEASCLRLLSAILMEVSEEWETDQKRYLVQQENG
jgi:transposase-like protein